MMENKENKGQNQNSATDKVKEVSFSLFLGQTVAGKKVLAFLQSIGYAFFISLITLITLFSDDFRLVFFSQNYDNSFSVVTVICMCIFGLEMIALSFVKEGYFLRYYFWLDIISTITLLFDITWFSMIIYGGGFENASKVVKIARASRVSKIGANSTKLIRILRLIRLLKMHKHTTELKKENDDTIDGIDKREGETKIAINPPPPVPLQQNPVRRVSKRMDRIRQASSTIMNEKKEGKHLISVKDITFEGSQRKLSALHPLQQHNSNRPSTQALGSNKIVSGKIDNINQKVPSNGQIQMVNVPHITSEDRVVSEDQNNNTFTKKIVNSGNEASNFQMPQETKLGSRLKNQIQKNIISMVLLVLISIPLLDGDTWENNVTSYEKSLAELIFFQGYDPVEYDAQLKITIQLMSLKPDPLVYIFAPYNSTCCEFPTNFPEYVGKVKSLSDIRFDAVLIFYDGETNTTIAYDQTNEVAFQSELNIGQTLFVCVLLIVMNILFTRDLEVYALQPIENMIDTVKKITCNPLQAIREIEKQKILKIQNEGEEHKSAVGSNIDNKFQTEPAILENMIVKIGSLLAVGFGQAGTELIAKNIQNYGSLNVMMPGKKVICIFGFCDIRNFTDATEVLESQVMVFVNEIAQICHEVVNHAGGNPNKNIGDAFLLVWKFREQDTQIVKNRHESTLELHSTLKVKQTADLAVYSFMKIIAEITRAPGLQKYKENAKLKNRIKGYEGVKMGFGLHVGWAIEGPIGSEFKIDASYLGPHVNVAGSLEGATKSYGVPMLISGDVYKLLTGKYKDNLRQVDKVKMKKKEQPTQLYTVDLSQSNLLKVLGLHAKKERTAMEKKNVRVYNNQRRDKLMAEIEKKRVTGQYWNEKDIKAMREPFSKLFYEEWKKGFEAYEKGEWSSAREIFTKTQLLSPNHQDGPSKALIDFMELTNFEPPANWEGVRPFGG